MKIDVAIQSYKKPESLIYTLLTLHRHCQEHIDVVWINDDRSGGNVLGAYRELAASGRLDPWQVKVRENTHRMGWWVSFVRGYTPDYVGSGFKLKRMAWNFYKNGSVFVQREDIRYEWAITKTDKKFVMVIHDDIEFKGDIAALYLQSILDRKNVAIVGDLGQCWRCDFQSQGCSPKRLLSGYRPSPIWPSTKVNNGSHAWACRINEWSALVNVQVAREISQRDKVFFGNFDANGDTSAYWFSRAVAAGYGFDDPLPTQEMRDRYYRHWEGGVTGHSVWVDQGAGRTVYDAKRILKRLAQDFDYCVGNGGV